MGESELVMRRDEIQALQAVLCRPPNDEFHGPLWGKSCEHTHPHFPTYIPRVAAVNSHPPGRIMACRTAGEGVLSRGRSHRPITVLWNCLQRLPEACSKRY